MAKVTIITEGVGLFYLKDGFWKVIFPFDENCHQVKFSFKKAGEEENESEPIVLAKPKRTIQIEAVNPTPASVAREGADIDDFLDLTANYSHANGIKLKDDWQEKAVFLLIPNAKFSVDKLTENVFLLAENDETKLIRKFANSGAAEIELEDKGNISIRNEENEEIFVSEPGFDYTLTFNNDCDKVDPAESTGDFEMVYNVIEDKENSARRFEERQYLGAMSMKKNKEMVFINVSPPSTTNRGLPCHKVRISNTEGLP